jgi:GDPmannose 4,6-dehydratase
MAAARIREGLQDKLYLGNLGAKRDWGFAADYVEGMWNIVQCDKPDDFVLATGETHTVREFCSLAFARLGFTLEFRGSGKNEIAVNSDTGTELIAIDPRYYRPTEVEVLHGDATKAKKTFGWAPRVGFVELVNMMADADLKAVQAREPFTLEPSLEFLRPVLS